MRWKGCTWVVKGPRGGAKIRLIYLTTHTPGPVCNPCCKIPATWHSGWFWAAEGVGHADDLDFSMLPLRCQRRSSGTYALLTYPVRRNGEGTCLLYGVSEGKPCNTQVHRYIWCLSTEICRWEYHRLFLAFVWMYCHLNQMDDEIFVLFVVSLCVGCYWFR